ncbi:MAG: GntR family transcriptional regulator [Hyphococcus sp.]
MNAFKESTIAGYVAAQLREQILSNEIKPGEPIRQNLIAERYGVSIIPVREAFRQLEAEGVVELLPRRGVVATEFTLEKALEWINIRRLLETDILGRAIDAMTDQDIDQAGAILKRFDKALQEHQDMKQWSALNWEFHSTLYAPADQPETMALLDTLHRKCDRYHRLQLLDKRHIARAGREHAALLKLCAARKKREAKALLIEHLKGVGNDLKQALPAKP